jgi:hypothetical protein
MTHAMLGIPYDSGFFSVLPGDIRRDCNQALRTGNDSRLVSKWSKNLCQHWSISA